MTGPSPSPRAIERRVRQHVGARTHEFFAVVQPGFEKTLTLELESLGIPSGVIEEGGVTFCGGLDLCYRVNMASRCATRVLMRITEFSSQNERELFRKTSSVPWELYLAPGIRTVVRASSSGSRLYHTGLISETCLNAINARLESFGITPAPPDSPAQAVYIRFLSDRCTISLDTSGEALYRRGRRRFVTEAPLRETLAALILREANLDRHTVLLDPMCGSGTFSLEAAEIASGILPGSGRDFPFMRWPAFRPSAFAHLCGEMRDAGMNGPRRIVAWDRDAAAVDAADKNLSGAGVLSRVELRLADFMNDYLETGPDESLLIVINPPYGRRLEEDVIRLYRGIGSVIRNRYPLASFAVITAGKECEKALDLPWDRKILFFNGGIPVGLVIRDFSNR